MASSVKNEEIPDHWLCPVCLEIPEKEVYQCRDGHILCSICYFKVPEAKCPQCRDSLDRIRPTRNRMMEEVLDGFRVNCKFKRYGCDKRLSKWSVAKHETECGFNIAKFGQVFNLCKKIGYPNCDFEFNHRNMKEAVEHFVAKHGCIFSTSQRFTMELVIFKDSAKVGGNGFEFWTPIITDLKEKKCFVLTMAIMKKNDACFTFLSILLPYMTNGNSSPMQVGYKLETGDNFKIWIEKSMTLKEANELLPNKIRFTNYSPAFVADCSVDGSLLIKCNIKGDLAPASTVPENVESFICTKNVSSVKSAAVEAPAPKGPVRFDREGGSLAATAFRKRIEKGRWKKRNSYLPALQTLYGPAGFTQKEVEWLKTDFIFTTARYGSVEAVKYLIERKVDFNIVNESGDWPLHLAMDDEDRKLGLEKARLMLERGGADARALNSDGWGVLHLSARFCSNEAVKYFLLKGCDVNGATPLGDTPLHLVTWSQLEEEEEERVKIAETLLANGADPKVENIYGRTPIDVAGRYKRVKIERLLRSQQFSKMDTDDEFEDL